MKRVQRMKKSLTKAGLTQSCLQLLFGLVQCLTREQLVHGNKRIVSEMRV